MSRNILNEGRIFINTITGGDAINISSTNSTSTTCNLKISKQTANTSIADTDLFVLETAAGDIKKITGVNMKSEIDTEYTAGTNLLLSVGNEFSLNPTISNNILFTGTPTINNFIELKGQSSQVGYINFYDTGTTNHISLLSPTTVSGSLNVILPSSAGTIALQDEIFFNRSTNEVSMKSNSYNLLLGTTSNSNSRKLLVVGDSEIQGDLYLQLNKKIISSNDSNDFLQFGNGTFTNNYSSNIFSKGIAFLAGDLQLPSGSGISLGSSATDKITFNAGNFTFGNTGIFDNSIQVKSTDTNNSGSVSFFEASVNGTNNIDLHCPEITTHDYNAYLPKITDTNITTVYILSNRNVLAGTNVSISNSTNDTITINSTDTNTIYLGGSNITVSGTVINLDSTLTGISITSPTITGTGAIAGVFTGNLTGNSDTSTKIASITNSNIVQLTTSQTLTNKTLTSPTITGTGAIAGVFTGNLTGNSDTSTKIASITNSNIVQLTTSQTLTNKTFDNTTIFNADLFLSGGSGGVGLDFYDSDNLLKITLEGQGDLTQNYVLTLPKLTGEIATLGDISSGENFGTNSSASVEVGNTSHILELTGSSEITYNATLHNFQTGLIKTQTKGIFIGNDNANALNTEVGINHSAATANGISFLTCFLSESQIGDIRQQTSNSVSFNTSSDYRLKTNIETINCLELVNKLKVKKFNFKSDLDIDIVGFMAHEVQEVDNLFNSVVNGEKDEMSNWDNVNKCWTDNTNCECKAKYQSIDYGKLTPFNTRAIQELYAIIQQQQTVINNLLSSSSFKEFKSK